MSIWLQPLVDQFDKLFSFKEIIQIQITMTKLFEK
jgi:hypothetical protein